MLVSIGRQVDTQGLGLENAGVTTNDKGEVEVDSQMRTNVEGVWAIGDMTDCQFKLAHVASVQGMVAVENIAGKTRSIDYLAVPSCVFTSPEIAWTGMTEAEAKEKGLDYKVGKFPFLANGKALSMGKTDGFVKIIAGGDNGIIGVHIIGPHASNLIGEGTLAVQKSLPVEEFVQVIRAHPTLPEAVGEAAEALLGEAIHI